MSSRFTVVLEAQDEGGYTARCLELPAAISQGETIEEALKISVKLFYPS
ncbi:MAG: type II toxin-antitoxin system HicB family antitoxin [Candidatus Hecatellales archaeon]|nr:MAG: type II toxin-antitoxin system HicB family antitoxin [Candidatus Hecatellales archaeon]